MELVLTEIAPTAPRKSIIAFGIIAFVVVAIAALWFFSPKPEAPGLDLSRSKASDKGLYSVAIEPEGGQVRQNELQTWIVTLTTPAGAPVEAATITVDGGMPEHNHGLPTSPAATAALGAGKYRVDGVKFHMSGWWRLKFAIAATPGLDTATFNLQL